MAHWAAFTLRGWIAFLAFMNLGTAARCFIDDGFMHSKFFTTNDKSSEVTPKGNAVIERLFGFWSVINGIIFLHCAIFIQDSKILGIAACALILYLCFFSTEIFVYKTIDLNGATLYPFAMTALSLFWLLISYRFVHHPDIFEDFDENEFLRKKFPYKAPLKKMN